MTEPRTFFVAHSHRSHPLGGVRKVLARSGFCQGRRQPQVLLHLAFGVTHRAVQREVFVQLLAGFQLDTFETDIAHVVVHRQSGFRVEGRCNAVLVVDHEHRARKCCGFVLQAVTQVHIGRSFDANNGVAQGGAGQDAIDHGAALQQVLETEITGRLEVFCHVKEHGPLSVQAVLHARAGQELAVAALDLVVGIRASGSRRRLGIGVIGEVAVDRRIAPTDLQHQLVVHQSNRVLDIQRLAGADGFLVTRLVGQTVGALQEGRRVVQPGVGRIAVVVKSHARTGLTVIGALIPVARIDGVVVYAVIDFEGHTGAVGFGHAAAVGQHFV